MATIIITLEGRVADYIKNISESSPEIWDKLKPDKVQTILDSKDEVKWN